MTEHIILKFFAMDSIRIVTFLLLTPCIRVNCARPQLTALKTERQGNVSVQTNLFPSNCTVHIFHAPTHFGQEP